MARRRLSLSETIERCQTRLAADPQSLAFAQLADAYRKQGRLDEAIELCQQGLEHSANYATAYMVLGRARQEKGDLLAAREAFQWVLHLDPESVQALKFLGQIAETRNEAPDALAAYRMALIFHPFDKHVRATVARLEQESAIEVESAPTEVAEAPLESRPAETEAVPSPAPLTPPVAAEEALEESADSEPLATETMAGLYAAQGLYDRASDIYGRLAAESPEREDLSEKYREALGHLEARAEEPAPTTPETVEALNLLETWRDVFRHLRRRETVSVAPLEARRDAFQQVHRTEKEPVPLLESWRDAFRRLRSRPRGPTDLLEAWRDAFRRLKTAKEGGTG